MAKRRTVILSILVALLLAAAGFVASLYLIPSETELEKLIAMDSQMPATPVAPMGAGVPSEKAKEKYLNQVSSGNVSYQAAEVYAQSLIAANDQEGASRVWKDYVEKNPEDLAGWKEYARLHQSVGDEEGYLEGLRHIARLDPTEANLSNLSGYQNYKEDYEGQVETLKKLVAMTNEEKPDYLLALADVSLLAKDDEAALAALGSYYTKHANALNESAEASSAPDTVIGGELQDPVPVTETKPEPVEEAKKESQEDVATEKMQEPVENANATEEQPSQEDAPTQEAEKNIKEESAETTDGMEKESETKEAEQSVEEKSDAEEVEQPADGAVPPPPPPPPLPAGAKLKDGDANLFAVVSPAAATEEMVVEAQSAPEKPKGADYSRLPVYIKLLAEADRKEEALAEALEHTKDGRGESVRDQVAEMLLAYVGAAETVEYVQTISAQGDIPEPLQAVYARALVQQGQYKTALPMLKKLSEKGGDFREWYFLSLSAAAKEDSGARRDLVAHVKESFASGELTEAQKLDRVYALLNAGERARALDYTERSMHATEDSQAKEKWRDLYKALTVKPKPAVRVARAVPRVSLDQKLALSRRSSTSEDYIRKTAFELLAAKRKDDAVELFSVLAARNGPYSSDANQLIYLWGPRVTGSELGWLVDQAATSTGQEQAGWVAILSNHAAAEDVIAIAQAYPNWLGYQEFEKRYVNALTATDNITTLHQYLTSQAANPRQSAEVYHSIASQAQSVFDFATAEQALQKSAQIDPSNRETWLRLTSMYVSRARYSAAEQTSENAQTLDGSSAKSQQHAAEQELASNFYAAAIAKRNGEEDLANQYHARVVQVGQAANLNDRDSRVKLLSSQMALGNEQAAAQGFEDMLEQYPGDAVLFADYLSALLDREKYDYALDATARHGNDISVDDAAVAMDDPSPLLIRSPSGQAPLLQAMSGGSELKLIFDGPIPNNHALYANSQAPGWVAYTTASYDTALIVAHSGYSMQAAETPDGLVVSAVPSAKVSTSEAARQRYLRLQLLYSRLELETGSTDKALERLESLASIYQEYPEYRAYQGNVEYYASNLTRGLNLVKRAQKGDPGNEDIRYLRRNIERFHGEHLKLDHEYRRLGDHDMHITTAEARKQFNNEWEVTARYQNNFFDTDLVQRSNGAFGSFDGHRWQGELSLAYFTEDSSIMTGSLYANHDTLGGGLSYQFVNELGTTNVYGEWRKPYWDIVESVLEDGTRDRFAVWHLWRPTKNWTVRIDPGYNNYNIADESNIADSVGVRGLVLRTLLDKQPYLALAYGFDGEYFLGNVERGAAGNKLLPLRDREIHSLSGIGYYDFSEDTNAELSLGYAVDRLGEHGPAVEGRIHHYLTEEVELQLRGRYGLEAGNTDNDALSVGGYVRWTW